MNKNKKILLIITLFILLIGNCSLANDNNLEIQKKEEFKPGLTEINKLQTYNYTYKADKTKTKHVGVIAQDLQKVFPNSVSKNKNGFLQIRQEEMFYAMLNAIKELDKITQGIKQEIKTLFAKVDELSNQLISMTKSTDQHLNSLETENKQLEKEHIQLKEEHKQLCEREKNLLIRLDKTEKKVADK